MRIIGLAEARIWPNRLVLDLSSANGAPPAGFKSLRDRILLLAAGDECDRIHQPCFVRAKWGPASENQACQCQRQNGLTEKRNEFPPPHGALLSPDSSGKLRLSHSQATPVVHHSK